MSQTLVLSIGFDLALLDIRNQVLQSAGYIVVSAMSAEEAIHLFRDGDFDLVILCHSLPIEHCERLTRCIRNSGSRIPVAYVSGEFRQSPRFTDTTLEKTPGQFLAGIRDLLAGQNHMPSIVETKPDIERTIISKSRSPISKPDNGRADKATQNNAGAGTQIGLKSRVPLRKLNSGSMVH